MDEIILRWINGKRNFTVGVLLYQQFGANEDKKKLFAAGKNAISEAALLNALQLLLEEKEIVIPKEAQVKFEAMPDGDDQVFKSFKDAWLPLFSEMNLKRHRLDQYLEDTSREAEIKRAELAKDILYLEQQCMAVWAKRDFYSKHGHLPNKSIESEVVVDEFKAAKQIERTKTYIRQYRKKVRDNPGNPNHAAKLLQFEKELTELQNRYENRI